MSDLVKRLRERYGKLDSSPYVYGDAPLIGEAADALEAAEKALEAEEEWRGREAASELDDEWDYEVLVGSKRRAALAKIRGK